MMLRLIGFNLIYLSSTLKRLERGFKIGNDEKKKL